MQVVEVADCKEGDACGYVQDLSLDLQIGVIKSWLLLGSQDAAHDLETMKKYKVTHVLNVAYGVENAFPNDFTYKTIPVLDLPETDITSCFPECFEFIEQIKLKGGVVLVHCNAGVSRAAAIIIGFLMYSEGLNFAMAFSVEVASAFPTAGKSGTSALFESDGLRQEGGGSGVHAAGLGKWLPSLWSCRSLPLLWVLSQWH
ncbi:dual specificity protein phosphatase 19 [Crotalus adamanteus]|uniref:Dual specificity protein phosphatase 19 n=1 Tax=Crotalus adamanteus TaxID=8729 RepID=A0AAW1CAJ5_CROAD